MPWRVSLAATPHLSREIALDRIALVKRLCKPSPKTAIHCHPLPFAAAESSSALQLQALAKNCHRLSSTAVCGRRIVRRVAIGSRLFAHRWRAGQPARSPRLKTASGAVTSACHTVSGSSIVAFRRFGGGDQLRLSERHRSADGGDPRSSRNAERRRAVRTVRREWYPTGTIGRRPGPLP